MGKQIKKIRQERKKKSRYERLCERCGNESFSFGRVWKCPYCKLWNGVEDETNRFD